MTREHALVVGAGLAGLRAAEAMRRAGFDGTLTIIGDERHRPYNRPPLSKKVLAGTQDENELPFPCDGLEAEWMLTTSATALDTSARRVALADGQAVPYDRLVITTGCQPRRPPGVPELEGLHELRTVDDARRLRGALRPGARLAIVGAGFVGCEVAATAIGMGVDVSVVDVAPVPMPRLASPIAEQARRHLEDAGVNLRLGATVREYRGRDTVEALTLDDGTHLDADVVLLAVGARPSTDWLADSGLQIDDGVVCDSYGFAAPGVVAAGDVARFPHPHRSGTVRVEHWNNAPEMGTTIGTNVIRPAGERMPFRPIPSFWSDQCGHRLQCFGFGDIAEEYRAVDDERLRGVLVEGLRGGEVVSAAAIDGAPLIMRYRAKLAALDRVAG